jgi:hypothetical protein
MMSLAELLTPLAIELAHRPLHDRIPLVVTAPTSAATLQLLSGVTPQQLLIAPIQDWESANALLAGLWLGHDALEEGHRIAQEIDTPSGSFWHAIMHRREGDFSNAKYWYARCRRHPVQPAISAQSAMLAKGAGIDTQGKRLTAVEWDGPELVDLVASVYRRPADIKTELAQRLQQIEWEGLFEYCAARATTMAGDHEGD